MADDSEVIGVTAIHNDTTVATRCGHPRESPSIVGKSLNGLRGPFASTSSHISFFAPVLPDVSIVLPKLGTASIRRAVVLEEPNGSVIESNEAVCVTHDLASKEVAFPLCSCTGGA